MAVSFIFQTVDGITDNDIKELKAAGFFTVESIGMALRKEFFNVKGFKNNLPKVEKLIVSNQMPTKFLR